MNTSTPDLENINREAGFSLIEALIATTLLAMIATMSVILFAGFFNGRAAQEKLTGLTEKTLRLRQIMGDDLAHAVIRPHGPAENIHLFSGDNENNCFLSFARHNALKGRVSDTASDIESLLYCLNGRQLVRYAYHEADAVEATKRRNYVIASDVKSVSVRFYDGRKWQRKWLMGVEKGRFFGRYSRLPSLVELTWTPAQSGQFNTKARPIKQIFPLPAEKF